MQQRKQAIIDRLLAELEQLEAEHLMEMELRDQLIGHSTPQVISLDAKPKAEKKGRKPQPPPETLLDDQLTNLLNIYPGILFDGPYTGVTWMVGYSLDKSRLVFVHPTLYSSYLDEVGWSGEPDMSNPNYRSGVWKARQVAHWIGEGDSTPELDYPVWSNGTMG